MDSFSLQQQQDSLVKNVAELRHKLEVGETRIKELHEEEMAYLKDIPSYKKQAQDAKDTHVVLSGKTVSLMASLALAQKDFDKVKGLVAEQEKALADLKETQKKIIEETKVINEQIKQRHEQLKQRELAIGDREKSLDLREVGCKNREFDLDKREVDLSKKEMSLNKAHEILRDSQESLNKNLEVHANNVRSLAEQRKFHEEDKNVLQDKIYKADKLVKDHINLKAQLLLQAENTLKAQNTAEEKQKFLDKVTADLKNQENAVKIRELKVNKLIKDHALEKELAELSK